MKPKKAKSEFEKVLQSNGLDIARLSMPTGIELMLDFYRDVRAKGCDDADTDMLLYQWGEDSSKQAIEVDITRQLIFSGWGDENIWQLSLTFSFHVEEGMEGIASGNKWCPKPHSKAIDYFKGFIESSEAYAATKNANTAKVTLDYFHC